MEKELGLFPLNLVAFPGECLNLHIFEPRYKQLIKDCIEMKLTFGVPSFVNKKMEYGTEMEIIEVAKKYADGRLDIRTRGLNPIRVLQFLNPWKGKLYAGGLVEEVAQDQHEDSGLKMRMIDLAGELFSWLKMENKISITRKTALHEIIHKIGLTQEEEYEVLKMRSESERIKFVVEHLKKVLPALERADRAKQLINLNGHFKNMDPLKF